MNCKPLVSIGMPVFNCGKALAEAIRSIQLQTFEDWELLIIDDGSTDHTLQVAREFSDPRIRVIEGGCNRGLPTRLNECVALAKGKYFARMDGDDIAYPERLSLQLDFLANHPEVDLLGSSILVFEDSGKLVGLRPAKLTHDEICGPPWRACVLAHNTWIGPIEWFRANLYRTDAYSTQDRELLLRTRKHSRFAAMPDVFVAYRQNRISVQKSLNARIQFSRALVREGFRQGDYAFAVLGVCGEIGKLLLDGFAVVSGLKYTVLRHRAAPIQPAMATQWLEVRRTICLTS